MGGVGVVPREMLGNAVGKLAVQDDGTELRYGRGGRRQKCSVVQPLLDNRRLAPRKLPQMRAFF